MMRISQVLLLAGVVVQLGCPPARPQELTTATAQLESKSGVTLQGIAVLVEQGPQVAIEIRLQQAPPGKHAVAIHEVGDCRDPQAENAAGHFNPSGEPHGGPDAGRHHLGDLGNIDVELNNIGVLKRQVPGLSVRAGDRSVVGRAIVVYEEEDDLKTQPAGATKKRIACGVLKLERRAQ